MPSARSGGRSPPTPSRRVCSARWSRCAGCPRGRSPPFSPGVTSAVLGGVPERVPGHLHQVPVVVPVGRLVADAGRASADRLERLQPAADPARILAHEGHVAPRARRPPHLEGAGAAVVDEPVEAQQQRLRAVRVGVLGEQRPLGRVGDEVGQVVARPGERADEREAARDTGCPGHPEEQEASPQPREARDHWRSRRHPGSPAQGATQAGPGASPRGSSRAGVAARGAGRAETAAQPAAAARAPLRGSPARSAP
jgi:hypothetical protein